MTHDSTNCKAVTESDGSKLAIEERCLIDEKIVELYESIRQLNSRRNELAPISVLPPELLGRIFTFLTPTKISDIAQEDFALEFMTSLNWTHVSQNWRNIALDTPALWDTPAFLYPTWARVMLERSKMADLIVDVDTLLIANPSLSFLKEVFDNHAARIREVNLLGLGHGPWPLSSILGNVQPSSLRLRSLRLSTSEFFEADDRFPVFPANLLVQPDGLRRLEIKRCAFDLYAQPRPLLTHLSMQSPRDRPLLSEFVTTLSGMPALETLEMVDSLPLAINTVKFGLKVELPKLSFLRLSSTGNIFEVLNVANLLIVPWTCRINLSCIEATSQPEDTEIQLSNIISPLAAFFSSMTGNVERRSYDHLRLYDRRSGFGLSARRTNQVHDAMPTDLPDLELSLNLNDQSDTFFGEMFPFLSLFDLQILVLEITFGPDGIYNLFGQSTTIQTVELRSNGIREFLQALVHKPEGYERLESSYYSVSFPALQTLKFNETSFRDDTMGELLECLMERCERGAPLQKLELCWCFNIGSRDVSLLREIVPEVEWDQIVQSSRHSEEYEDSQDYEDYEDYDDHHSIFTDY